jgi:hypothetical protein
MVARTDANDGEQGAVRDLEGKGGTEVQVVELVLRPHVGDLVAQAAETRPLVPQDKAPIVDEPE